MSIIEGGRGPIDSAGVPGVGTNAVQTLTVTATGGTYALGFEGFWTTALAFNAVAATIQAALEALPSVGTGGIVVTSTGPWTLTFSGANLARKVVPVIGTNNTLATGGTAAIVNTTPGVEAFARGIAKGGLVRDTTNGKLYINTGTPTVPVYAVVGTQT